MVKRAQQSTLSIHRQIPRSPNRWCAHIARNNRVLGRKLVERLDDVLRMDLFSSGSRHGQRIEVLARHAVVLKQGLQMFVAIVLLQSWQKSPECRSRVAYKSIVDLGTPPQLLSPDVNLRDLGVFGVKLLIGKVGANHQQKVAVHYRVISGRKSQQSRHPDVERVVALNDILT